MSDQQQTPSATPASLPNIDDVQKMSPGQASAKLTELGAQEDFRNKLFSGDGKAAKLFEDLTKKRSQTEIAEAIVAVVADPNAPQPVAGGANKGGMSKANEVTAAQWHLETGASIEELGEWELNEAMVSLQDYKILEAQFNSQCLANPQWVQKLLTGDPAARLTLDRWKRIMVTSKPLPPVPTTGIAR